jgi:hypothetical protein
VAALRPTVHYSVPPQAVAGRAPHEFRDFVDLRRLSLASYTVIAYPGMRGESSSIVNSKTISRVLPQAAARGDPIVAIAHNFTAEALDVLEAQGAIVFRRNDHFWSDESYAAIRT